MTNLVADRQAPGAQEALFLQRLLQAFQLPQIYREVFLLKEIQGHTLAEIAAILGISAVTVRARLQRARREFGRLGDSDAMERPQ